MYWDGSAQDQLLDGNVLDKYDVSSDSFSRLVTFYDIGPSSTCNGSKNTPNLSADILGDWREELILYTVSDDETYLGIYSSNIPTSYTEPTLMHDHTYRMAVCWQNTAYNQPPHLGYNLAESVVTQLVTDTEFDANVDEETSFVIAGKNVKALSITKSVTPSGVSRFYNVPTGFTRTTNNTTHTLTISGTPSEEGDYQFIVRLTGMDGTTSSATILLHSEKATGIVAATSEGAEGDGVNAIYDMSGRKMPVTDEAALPEGVYIIKTDTPEGKVTRKIVK